MSYKDEIKTRLADFPRQYSVAFAARAALRCLPALANRAKGDVPFWYWSADSELNHLLKIFQAVRLSFVIAGLTQHTAYSNIIFELRAAADAYAAADIKIFMDEDLRNIESGMALFVFLQQPLLTGATPERWKKFKERFDGWAKSLDAGFDHWLDWYQERLEGKEVDWELALKQIDIPSEIEDQGVIAVNRYLATLVEAKQENKNLKPLNRVRAIFIGNGAAGKTSLIRALNGQPVVEGKEAMTPGIDIHEWPLDKTDITAHFWDFGGQVIAHSTHQFFLRERCLYILVLDARTEINANEQAEYWLEHVRAFGRSAPVMLVGNKSDLVPVSLNLTTLREKYPNIIDFYPLSCTQCKGDYAKRCGVFRDDLIAHLEKVGVHQVYFTDGQFSVLQTLRARSPKNSFLPHHVFKDICEKHHVPLEGAQNQAWLLDLFDKLGVVIHFPQLARLDSYILNPSWLTYGIYSLLYSEEAKNGKGILSENEVIKILTAKEIKDELGNSLDYPAEKGFVIDAMEEFKLCYRLPSDHKSFVNPDLLPTDQPSLTFDKNKTGTLVFEFAFRGFLPRHVMPTFIVSRYDEIKDNAVWQQGVLLHNAHYQCDALIQVDYHARTFSLWVQGEQVSRYFTVLRDQVTVILNRMSELQYVEWVWLSDEMRSEKKEPVLRADERRDRANFLQLLKMEQANQMTFISESGESYDVRKILQIMPDTFRHQLASRSNSGEALDSSLELKIFISYAHEDEDYKNDLVKALKALQREYSQLQWWDDRQMDAGDWDKQIIGKMEQADMVLLLISRDFIVSNYCFNKEMKTALRKYEEHGHPLIPIVVRHTADWNRHEIGKFKALPKDAKPLDEWDNADRFWGDVQKGLRRELEQLLVKKGS